MDRFLFLFFKSQAEGRNLRVAVPARQTPKAPRKNFYVDLLE